VGRRIRVLKLLKKEKVISSGRHNAFTDIIYFKGKYYLAFRSGKRHMSRDGDLLISGTSNFKGWQTKTIFSDENYDVRDAKLYLFKRRLFCIFPVRYTDEDRFLSLVIFTEDGSLWSKPRPVQRRWSGSWRPKLYKGRLYAAFYSCRERFLSSSWKSALFTSEDGLRWRHVSIILKGESANETDICFLQGGKLMAVIRREGKDSVLAFSLPPYKVWEYKSLGVAIHSPCLKVINRKLLLSGRKFNFVEEIMNEKREYSEEVTLWEWKRGDFIEALSLEAGNNIDCGYCGLEKVKGKKEQAVVSYYFGDTTRADIWVAKIKV